LYLHGVPHGRKIQVMEINRMVLGIIVLLVLCLVLFIVIKNKRDRKKLENRLNEPDMRPERHEEEE